MLRATSPSLHFGLKRQGGAAAYHKGDSWFLRKKGHHFRKDQGRETGWSQFNHKLPHEWKESDEYQKDKYMWRCGREWFLRYRRKGQYSTWPFVTWQHDPVRNHRPDHGTPRTISAAMGNTSLGKPLWNHYEEAANNYGGLRSDACLRALVPLLNTYVGRLWTPDQTAAFLAKMSEEGWETVEELHESIDYVEEWNSHFAQVPPGFVEHIKLLVGDIVSQNKRKEFRIGKQNTGVLRDTLMKQYYAMPYYTGPHSPEKLAQTPGIQPISQWTLRVETADVHPMYGAGVWQGSNFRFGRSE